MKTNKMFPLLAAATLLAGSPSYADEYSAQEVIKSLQARLEALEAEKTDKDEAPGWADKLVFAGLVEVEAGYVKDYTDVSSSDIVVATVELGLAAEINDAVSSEIVFLYEEDDTEFDVDVAVLNFTATENVSFTVGQTYLPFGIFEAHIHSVNDPLILEMTETVETVAIATYEAAGFTGQLYAFNGDVDKGNDTVENYGMRLAYVGNGLSVGIDYISNILDSDGISGFLDDGGIVLDLESYVGAGLFNLSYDFGSAMVIFEALQLDQFKAAEFGGPGDDLDVTAYQIEGAVDIADWTLSMAYQETEDALALSMPEQRLSMTAYTEVFTATNLAIELWQDEDYSLADGGTGEDSLGLVVQLAVEF